MHSYEWKFEFLVAKSIAVALPIVTGFRILLKRKKPNTVNNINWKSIASKFILAIKSLNIGFPSLYKIIKSIIQVNYILQTILF